MADQATIRAGNADRDRTVSALGEGMAAGRLTAEEFHQRLDLAYAAKRLGELDRLAPLGSFGYRSGPASECRT